MRANHIVLLLMFLGLYCRVFAQENIPLGEWRLHVSYNRINSVSSGDGKVFASSQNGIVVVDVKDKSFQTRDKLNSLTRADIRFASYHPESDKLFVAYEGGSFDVLLDNVARNFDPSKNTVLTGLKEIHSITFHESLAYLSTDYGVVVFDLGRNEIKETWRDLGEGGTTIQIFGTAFFQDSVFLATAQGILAADPRDNLLDFNKWRRVAEEDLAGSVQYIDVFNNGLYAAVNGVGLYKHSESGWGKQGVFDGVTFTSVQTSATNLLITESGRVWSMDLAGEVSLVETGISSTAQFAFQDESGKIWIGDRSNGIVTNYFGGFESIIPNGPASDISSMLAYYDKNIYAVPGGFSGTSSLGNDGVLSKLEKGSWSFTNEAFTDITAVAGAPEGELFLSSFGHGVLQKTTGILFNETNSTLVNASPPGRNVRITDLHYSADGLWVANQGTLTSLHLFSASQWQAFSLPFTQAAYPLKIITDLEGNVWMLTDPVFGGGIVVVNKENGESILLNELDGNGELPSSAVYSIALDRDGYIWAGTDAGVAYFYDEGSDAVKPIYENRFLLRDETVSAIAVDAGNRKWMGTERGVWLFDPSGEKALANFTQANSPLLSDNILDIEIDPVSGEVFFATSKGLVSFRSDATESNSLFRDVRIFPNPVTHDFTGQVGISGLATDSVVKITDASGRLVFQTTANGGTASWDVRDHRGRRVSTGVFLVFAVTPDGSESVVGKIAVVN